MNHRVPEPSPRAGRLVLQRARLRLIARGGGSVQFSYTSWSNDDVYEPRSYQQGDRLVYGHTRTIIVPLGAQSVVVAELAVIADRADVDALGREIPRLTVGDLVPRRPDATENEPAELSWAFDHFHPRRDHKSSPYGRVRRCGAD